MIPELLGNQENLESLDPEAEWLKKYEAMPYKDLAERMLELKQTADEAKRCETTTNKELDVIRLKVVPVRFAADGFSSLNIPGVGRLGLTKDAYCTQVKDKQPEFFSWLRDNDYGDLIKDTVNPSSLKSLVKELAEESAEQAPEFNPGAEAAEVEEISKFDEMSEFVNFIPFMRASVTKK